MKTFVITLLTLLCMTSAVCAETVLLREDFNVAGTWQAAFAAGTWDTGYQEAVQVNSGVASVTSLYPHLFWVDRNHGDPGGLGDLNMVLHTCLTTEVRNGVPCVSGIPALDLRGAKLRIRLRARCCDGTYAGGGIGYAGPTSGPQARLVWWFDTFRPSGTAVNMAAIGTPLDDDLNDGEWHIVEIAPQLNDWACLGSINSRTDFYGCDPAHLVLGNVNVAIGLILFPIDRDNIPIGRIEIDWLEIVRP